MTNAYKHAFPEGSRGEICVNLSYAPGNAVILQISDNGIGMRPGSGEKSLGLELIRGFAAQLQGTLSFSGPVDGTGTTVTLTIHREARRVGV